MWTFWKHLLTWLADNLMGPTLSAAVQEAKNQVAQVMAEAMTDGAPAPAEHRAQLQHLKKASGSALKMSPLLLSDNNLLNSRIMLPWIAQQLAPCRASTVSETGNLNPGEAVRDCRGEQLVTRETTVACFYVRDLGLAWKPTLC